MKKFFVITGWAILLAVILINRLAYQMPDLMVILLSVIAAVFLCIGILTKNAK